MPDREKFQDRDDKHEVYDWWNGEDLADFFASVEEQGAENVRIEAHYYGEGEKRQVELRIVGSADDHGSYNVSHPCPPFCP